MSEQVNQVPDYLANLNNANDIRINELIIAYKGQRDQALNQLAAVQADLGLHRQTAKLYFDALGMTQKALDEAHQREAQQQSNTLVLMEKIKDLSLDSDSVAVRLQKELQRIEHIEHIVKSSKTLADIRNKVLQELKTVQQLSLFDDQQPVLNKLTENTEKVETPNNDFVGGELPDPEVAIVIN